MRSEIATPDRTSGGGVVAQEQPRAGEAAPGPRTTFWLAYLRLGFVVLGGESVAALLYFVFSRSPLISERGALVAVAAVALALSIAVQPVLPWVARQQWRAGFSFAAALVSGILLTVCCTLDGGFDSPLTFLVVLPVLNASLALPLRFVAVTALAALGELGVMVGTDPHFDNADWDLAAAVALLGGTVVLAILGTMGRERLERREEEDRAQLARLAATDALTGCLNQGTFSSRLDEELDRFVRYGGQLSLLVADVDLFKSFNDRWGRQAGDDELARIGSRLLRFARRSDIVARVGGDEFALILPSTGPDEAKAVAERINTGIQADPSINVTLSIGVAAADRADPTGRQFFRDADSALYCAKSSGRRVVRVADRDCPAVPLMRTSESADLRLLAERVRQSEREKVESIALLEATMQATPVGLGFVDADFRLVRVNDTFATLYGSTPAEMVGRQMSDLVAGVWPTLEPVLLEVLGTGDAYLGTRLFSEMRTEPGRRHYWATSFFPVDVGESRPGFGIIAMDVTERQELEQGHEELMLNVVAALSAAVELHDPYTKGHQDRVADIAIAVADELGWSRGAIAELDLASSVHDIGKVRVPAEILSRPGRLTRPEMEIVRQHAEVGYDLLSSVGLPESLAQIVRQHHERLDGSGYPDALTDAEICDGARVVAVADVADAMTSVRPYRAALGPEVALAELQQGRGRLYDPAVVDAYVRISLSGTDVSVRASAVRATISGDSDKSGLFFSEPEPVT